jgi:hypothetical protein
LVAGGVAGAISFGGGDGEGGGEVAAATADSPATTADDTDPTTATTADTLPATTAPPAAEASDDCLSADELNQRVWNGGLINGVEIPDEEAAEMNANPERSIGRDVLGCIYEFDFTERFTASGGDAAENTGNVTLQYRSTTYGDDAVQYASDVFDDYVGDMKPVQELDTGDPSGFGFTLADVNAQVYEFYYAVDGKLCFGHAQANFISNDAIARLNPAANMMAAKIACDLEVDVPEQQLASAPETTTTQPAPELEGTEALPDGSTVYEIDGQTFRQAPDGRVYLVHEDGTEEFVGQGGS